MAETFKSAMSLVLVGIAARALVAMPGCAVAEQLMHSGSRDSDATLDALGYLCDPSMLLL